MMPPRVAEGGSAPHLLDGGLHLVYTSGVLAMSIIITGYLEGKSMNGGSIFIGNEKPAGYQPGASYNFDPFKVRTHAPRKYTSTQAHMNAHTLTHLTPHHSS